MTLYQEEKGRARMPRLACGVCLEAQKDPDWSHAGIPKQIWFVTVICYTKQNLFNKSQLKQATIFCDVQMQFSYLGIVMLIHIYFFEAVSANV